MTITLPSLVLLARQACRETSEDEFSVTGYTRALSDLVRAVAGEDGLSALALLAVVDDDTLTQMVAEQ